MPDDKLIDSVSAEELWEHRGGIVYLRVTPGTRRWIRLLSDPRVPDLDRLQTTVLTGRHNRDLLDLGAMQPLTTEAGREIYTLWLDDPHPAELTCLSQDLRPHLPRTMSAKLLRQAWEAFLLQTYLHELGHARYCRRHGWGGRSERHEEQAERYAWRMLERLCPPEAVLAAVSLFWMNLDD